MGPSCDVAVERQITEWLLLAAKARLHSDFAGAEAILTDCVERTGSVDARLLFAECLCFRGDYRASREAYEFVWEQGKLLKRPQLVLSALIGLARTSARLDDWLKSKQYSQLAVRAAMAGVASGLWSTIPVEAFLVHAAAMREEPSIPSQLMALIDTIADENIHAEALLAVAQAREDRESVRKLCTSCLQFQRAGNLGGALAALELRIKLLLKFGMWAEVSEEMDLAIRLAEKMDLRTKVAEVRRLRSRWKRSMAIVDGDPILN